MISQRILPLHFAMGPGNLFQTMVVCGPPAETRKTDLLLMGILPVKKTPARRSPSCVAAQRGGPGGPGGPAGPWFPVNPLGPTWPGGPGGPGTTTTGVGAGAGVPGAGVVVVVVGLGPGKPGGPGGPVGPRWGPP